MLANAARGAGSQSSGRRAAEQATPHFHTKRYPECSERPEIGGSQLGEQLEGLEDEADPIAPKCGELIPAERGELDSLDRDGAAARSVEAAEKVE